MHLTIHDNAAELGQAAAVLAVKLIVDAVNARGHANIILATGASQFEVLAHLTEAEVPWEKVTMFHLDEYIGLPYSHPASFRKYLTERFLEKIAFATTYHLINGENEPQAECARVSALIIQHPIDVALVGIGENGHLAFNDPPADFETADPYIVVDLDEACRRQQFGEGWFDSMEAVPRQAISMSIRQIMKSKNIIVSVPDARKATAVKNTLEKPISPLYPASILRQHTHCYLFLDQHSAQLLTHASS